MPTAEIITIGTELLLGETVDTNTRFIAQTLRGLGVDLYRTQTVGDNVGRIADIIREAQRRADIVITTGGLGPTVDDPTRQAIAEACGAELEFHPELWEQIEARIARFGRTPTENQKRQAYIPKGAVVIENPVGTAPAFIVETPSPLVATPIRAHVSKGGRKKVIISLPGVPLEMETLLTDFVVPFLQKHFNLHDIIKIRTLHISGLGEGLIDDRVGDLETQTNPTIGLTAHSGIVDIRIAAKASTIGEAESMISKVEADIRTRLGENLFGTDGDSLEGVMLDALTLRGWTLACYESGLDGALTKRLTQIEHPSYHGGTIGNKREGELAQVTEAALNEFNATCGLGVTLSIFGEKQELAITAITPLGIEMRQLTYGGHPGNAARWAVNTALDWLRRIAQETG